MKIYFYFKRSFIVAFFFSTLLCNEVNAKNYYFSSSSGNDSYTSVQAQNPATPWQTLNKLNLFFSSLLPGDSILFKRGDVFYGSITINKSGTSLLPIILGVYGTGAKPIITGLTNVTGWTSVGTNLWESNTISTGLNNAMIVLQNGVFFRMGRYPLESSPNGGYLTYQSSSGTNQITSSGLTGTPDWTGAQVVVRKYAWNTDVGPITSQSGGTLTFTPATTLSFTNGFGFFIQNDIRTLVQQGDWYYNPTTKKLDIYSLATPTNIQISTINTLINSAYYKYITFNNLAFTGSNGTLIDLSNTQNITITNCDLSYAGIDGVDGIGASHFDMENCNISNSNNQAIFVWGYGNYVTLKNNTIANSGIYPGMITAGNFTNTAVHVYGNNSTIQYNTIIHSGYHGINFQGNNINVSNNYIDSFCTVKDDGGGIYTWTGGDTTIYTNRIVQNNIVLNAIGSPGGLGTFGLNLLNEGIYTDDNTKNVSIINNSVANVQVGIYLHNSPYISITGNTVYNATNGIFCYHDGGDAITNINANNNIYIAKKSTDLCFNYMSIANDFNSAGTWDSNYYARPINDNNTMEYNGPSYNLASWKIYSGKETHSKKSPKLITDTSKLRFEYNATSSNKVINLGATYIGIDSTIYSGTLTLAPYSSKVLIYLSGAIANKPPVANAGPDQSFFLPVNSTTLTGSGIDSGGTIVSYQWAQISGPNQSTIVSPTQAQTVISNLIQGVYQFQLTVTDNLGATGSATVTITVNPAPNKPPVANAGFDQSLTLPINFVTLTGSGVDSSGTIVSYQWTKISGPNQSTIVSPTKAQTVVNNLIQGVYQFQLKVIDNLGASGKATVTITVNPAPNKAPIADAGSNQSLTLPINFITLTGSGIDSSGTIVSYQWTQISGPNQSAIVSATQALTVVNNLVQGVYQFQLVVTDNLGTSGKATVTITVNPASNKPPVANAGSDQSITLPTNFITLTGSGTDSSGTIVSYQWTKISGPTQFNIVSPTQAQTVVNNLIQGVYQFQLTVTDNLGATGSATATITVNPAPNKPPVADAGSDQSITLPTNFITLTGSGTDSSGTIVSYQWTKISGPTQFNIVSPTQAQTIVNNLAQGIYQFQLTVTDNFGASGTATVTITVDSSPKPPIANAGFDQSITLPINSATLTGSGTDSSGTIVSYQWTKISGPSQFIIVSPTQAQAIVNNLVQGVYQFQLTVTDNLGASAKATVTVTVKPAVNTPPVADAGSNQTITLPTNSVTLTGSGTDPNGTIVSYQWTQIAGPAQFTIVSPTQAQTIVNNLVQGVYQFQLTVTDNSGASDNATVIVTVLSGQAPLTSTALIYPNPTSSYINIQINAATKSNVTYINIYNASGVLVYQQQFFRSQEIMTNQIDVSNLANGAYFVKISLDINTTTTLKFVKQ